MARYVVLSFEDNDEAEKFVEAMQYAQKYNSSTVKGLGQGCEVEGVFAKPTQFCAGSATGGCSQGKRYTSWVRGQKFGWWICRVCGKPSAVPDDEKRMRACVSQGVNLSPKEAPSEGAQTTGGPLQPIPFESRSW